VTTSLRRPSSKYFRPEVHPADTRLFHYVRHMSVYQTCCYRLAHKKACIKLEELEFYIVAC
jgi:hypothetical protein